MSGWTRLAAPFACDVTHGAALEAPSGVGTLSITSGQFTQVRGKGAFHALRLDGVLRSSLGAMRTIDFAPFPEYAANVRWQEDTA